MMYVVYIINHIHNLLNESLLKMKLLNEHKMYNFVYNIDRNSLY